MQNNKYTTIRIWTHSVQKLRSIYALTGETMVKILGRLLENELKRVQNPKNNDINDIKD